MNKEIFVSSTPHETRLAITENGDVAEVYYEREKEYSLAGAIYKGRVTRVLPGMQSAFVDIGLERDAFLYVSDFFEDSEEYDRVVTAAETAVARADQAGPEAQSAEVAIPEVPPPLAVDAAGEAEPPAVSPARPRAAESSAEVEAEIPSAEPAAENGRTAAPTPPPVRETREVRDDGRGRRGGRQRGGRGRGPMIPEEKFARPQAAREPAAPVSGAPAAPAFVLPGESLAKYRHEPQPRVALEPAAPAAREATAPAAAPEPGTPSLPKAAIAAPVPVPLTLPGESLAKYRAPAAAPFLPPADVEAAELPVLDVETERERFELERRQPDSPAPDPERLQREGGEAELDADLSDAAAADSGTESDASASVREPAGARMQAPARDGEDRGGRRHRRRRGRGRPEGGDAREPERAEPRRETRNEPRHEPRSAGKNESARMIGELLHSGQEILVQIAKEPLGKKGARITSHLALPGRYLVYMPTVSHIGVSRKIADDEARARLKRLILDNTKDLPGGFIVRTAAAAATDEELLADIRLLASQGADLRQQFEQAKAPALLHHDLNLVERTLRDQLSDDFTHIWVDTDEQYQRIVKFVNYFMPQLAARVRLYTRDEPMFEHFGIQEEINKALHSKVWLKSGGYIVLNQTEALVAIDVNTGKYVGRSNRLEDTIVKTNVEAIQEIVRQIRLRDLGGIIVIDFIDMDERRNRQRVMQALEEAMRADRAPSKVLAFNDFGLVALTRKRVKQSLERTLGSACPYCEGVGLVKSPITVCNEIYSEVRKVAPGIERDDLVLRVNPEVAKVLKSQGATRLREIEELARKAVSVRADPQVHQEQFEIY
jgi:Rne/Rng family ribonuclease